MVLNNLEDRLECAIRHINTALDIDPWAQNLAVESMRMRIALMKGSERKKGKWIDSHTTCSECGWQMIDDVTESPNIVGFNFCPNCGAKMEEGDE